MKTAHIYKESFEALFKIAESQQGLFTAKQAIEAGFDERNHPFHVAQGNWVREWRGIYRLKNFPHSDEWELVLWYLWSRNKEGIFQGVYSYETALSIYGLTNLMPMKLHMTVPKTFRRHSKIPKVLLLYHENLSQVDIRRMRGFCVTTPIRTIQDLMQRGTPEEVITQAVSQALNLGLMTREDYKKLAPLKGNSNE
ncbi:MAG: hypothetical protein HYW47_02555 [Deltaproteobacteria bacterium]|nr:hypothetical protein [Deltaproteobacteria bacterium]